MNASSLPRLAEVDQSRSEGMAWYDRVLAIATFAGLFAALYFAFVYAPTEAMQGDVQRIFYFHVSIAWLMYLAFFVVFLGSILYLWKRDAKWDILARSSAELGVVFTTLVLITGSIWGRPIWGAWWAWDARMTSTLILWAVYVVYLMLRSYSVDQLRGARFGAILGIVGFADVPIVQMSITWWRTLHPQPVISLEGSGDLPPQMLVALLVSVLAFTLFYVFMMRQRVQIEWLRAEIEQIRDSEA
jgi:heme exporter protein C